MVGLMATLYKFTNGTYNQASYHNSGSTASTSIPVAPMPNIYNSIGNDCPYVYVDIEKIIAVSSSYGKTVLHAANIGNIVIGEHISEVIALMEGRDALPSKILFGKKTP